MRSGDRRRLNHGLPPGWKVPWELPYPPHYSEHDCFACACLREEKARSPMIPELARQPTDAPYMTSKEVRLQYYIGGKGGRRGKPW